MVDPSLPSGPGLPSGTITFLLTDVEGSTALWEQAPATMRAALARHDVLFEDTVTTNRGVHIRPRGEGDSRFAVFASATDAVTAALEIQRAFAAEPWPTPRPVAVRIGLHAGEAELRDGDYYGSAVNRCARLRGIGHGGQILLSGATADLVRPHLSDDVTLRDFGPHRLKDLTQPERVSQLVAADIPADFPALTSLDARVHNLPIQPTSLLGRDREVSELRALLLESARLVTLLGPGGTGKTRLGLQIAAELADVFEHGVYLIELAPITDPALVPSSIVQALGVRVVGERTVLDALKEYLRDRSLLLLLDNFEQILPAATVVAELLAASSELRVLVTSRAPLRLRGEHEYPVSPLALPDLRQLPVPEALSRFPAVALFLERATTIGPGFALTVENAMPIATICTRLDGLPLAIELAAARIRLLTPQAMVSRLERRLPLLTGGARDLPSRQQTLRDTIAWSHDLLDEPERRLFRRLGVFVGGWTLEAAEAICRQDTADVDTLDGLDSLVTKSLVRQDEDAGAEVRFRLLETIREFSLEQLQTSGEEAAIRRRHAEHFLALAEQAKAGSGGVEQRTWLDRLEADHDNLRAALGWSLAAQPPGVPGATVSEIAEIGLRVAALLWEFWFVRGHFREGLRWLGLVLERNPTAPLSVRAEALHGAGQLGQSIGDFRESLAFEREALAAFREIGNTRSVGWTLIGLGFGLGDHGDYAAAEPSFVEALALFRGLDDRWGIPWALHGLARVARERGDHTRTDACLTEAIDRFRALGDQRGEGWATLWLGKSAHVQGHHERAQHLLATTRTLFQDLDNKRGTAHATVALGSLTHDRGEYPLASTLEREALDLCREIGDRRGTSWCLAALAALADAQGQPARAARLHGAAEATRAPIELRPEPADRVRLDQVESSARAVLGEPVFMAAWAEGRAMTIEQAIAYALDDPGRDAPASAS